MAQDLILGSKIYLLTNKNGGNYDTCKKKWKPAKSNAGAI